MGGSCNSGEVLGSLVLATILHSLSTQLNYLWWRYEWNNNESSVEVPCLTRIHVRNKI